MNGLIEQPGGQQAVRFLLNTLGSVPIVGGAIAGTGQLWGEKEQQRLNETIAEWATKSDADLKNVNDKMNELLANPTRAKLSLLFGEVLGNDLATQFLSKTNNSIHIALNSQTLAEFEPFIQNEWLNLKPTHSTVMMGAGNKVGNAIEELKRPYGMGNTFVLTITDNYFTE